MSEVADTAPSDAERAALLEARLAELETTMRAAAIRAELKTEAVRAGMVDLDWLKLVDTATVAVNGAGEPEGVAAVVAQLRRDKPWLFNSASSSSSANVPPIHPPKMRLATDMSYAEWQAARREMLRRR